jgi:hypothetical protein
MTFVTVLDEAPSGEQFGTRQIAIREANPTLRELIRSRIREEVDEFNRKESEVFLGLVQPTDAERVLNGYRVKAKRHIDWQEQYSRAIAGFEQNGFFVIIDGKQIEDLDQVLPLRERSEVHFLKLVPLVGG